MEGTKGSMIEAQAAERELLEPLVVIVKEGLMRSVDPPRPFVGCAKTW